MMASPSRRGWPCSSSGRISGCFCNSQIGGAAVGVPCILGSQAEMGIATAACAHLAVALPQLPYAIETFGPLRYARDIVEGPGLIAGGWLTPPEGPGLGVRLDWDAVNSMKVEL